MIANRHPRTLRPRPAARWLLALLLLVLAVVATGCAHAVPAAAIASSISNSARNRRAAGRRRGVRGGLLALMPRLLAPAAGQPCAGGVPARTESPCQSAR